jgi:hypothetical protein
MCSSIKFKRRIRDRPISPTRDRSARRVPNASFLGYDRQIRNKNGDILTTIHRAGCKKFYQLTGNHGPRVPAHAAACRYFQRKREAAHDE